MPKRGRGLPPGSADHPVIGLVVANPEPDKVCTVFDGQGTMSQTDAGGPEAVDALESKRRVVRVRLQEREVLVAKLSD